MDFQSIEEVLVGRRTLENSVAEARIESANTEIASAHRAQPPHHVGQLRIAQVRQAEICPGEVRSAEVSIVEVCPAEVGAGEVGKAEVCADEARTDQILRCRDRRRGGLLDRGLRRSNMQLSGSLR